MNMKFVIEFLVRKTKTATVGTTSGYYFDLGHKAFELLNFAQLCLNLFKLVQMKICIKKMSLVLRRQ